MIGTYFIIIAVIIGLAFLGLGISTFFGKKKKFPDTHIGKNKAMKERGISCAATTDRLERANYKAIEIKRAEEKREVLKASLSHDHVSIILFFIHSQILQFEIIDKCCISGNF